MTQRLHRYLFETCGNENCRSCHGSLAQATRVATKGTLALENIREETGLDCWIGRGGPGWAQTGYAEPPQPEVARGLVGRLRRWWVERHTGGARP